MEFLCNIVRLAVLSNNDLRRIEEIKGDLLHRKQKVKNTQILHILVSFWYFLRIVHSINTANVA